MSKVRRILFGPPGTGKTTTLLSEVKAQLKRGIAPDKVGFVSFSRRALAEARDKAKEVTTEALPHFRTIHSTAYHLLGLDRSDVLQEEHLRIFGEKVGLNFQSIEPDLWEGTPGDKCLALYALARARATSLEQEWRRAAIWDLPWQLVNRTVVLYEQFKSAEGLWDFSDMITKAEGTLDVDVLFVDEAQDTSTAQWQLLRRIASHVPVVYFAGDDDQAVYQWSGADPDQLLRWSGQRHVLPHSYRLPSRVKQLADSLALRIKRRVAKEFEPRGVPGMVTWLNDLDHIDLHSGGTWLLLARSNYQLRSLRQMARQQGVVYSLSNGEWSWTLPSVRAALAYERLRKGKPASRADVRVLLPFMETRRVIPNKDVVTWEDVYEPGFSRERTWMEALPNMPIRDREYVRALRRSGESLTHPGRVRIGTVHSVKGAEADHVVLVTDISERVAHGARLDPDAELRVQYVAVTRARESVRLMQPTTQTFWTF